MGTKAIIKINDRFCKQEEINRIAIVAPMAVVNIIRDFKVVEKHAVTIPETIRGFVKCANPEVRHQQRTGRNLVPGDP